MWEGFFMEKEKSKITNYLFTALIQTAVIVLSISIFALVMNFAEIDYKYSPVFGSVAIGLSSFGGAFYLAKRKGNRGYLTGLIIGGITFLIVTLVGMILNDGGITVNTLFHFIIIMLSAITGGIMGVNKNSKKYI